MLKYRKRVVKNYILVECCFLIYFFGGNFICYYIMIYFKSDLLI